MTQKFPHLRGLATAAMALALLGSGTALAESTYGYSAAGTGTVTATARVNLQVLVPKLILLRIGSAGSTVDQLSWSATASIPAGSVAPTDGAGTGVTWDGTAPTITAGTQPGGLSVAAWSNGGTSTINCAVGAWNASGGPTNADFAVTSTGTLNHPGANLGACASTSFTGNSLRTGTWSFSLNGTPSSWTAGTYTNTVTYTVSGV